MTVWCCGSINIDKVVRVPHFPAPGETLAASDYAEGLGGKGANQSVAAARAGARVQHLGAVGPEGGAMLERLQAAGVDTSGVLRLTTPTGMALILVDPAGENSIVILAGANRALPREAIAAALAAAAPGDTLMLQNETAHVAAMAAQAAGQGMRVIYSAAPFDADAVRAVLPHVSVLLLNVVEAGQLAAAMGAPVESLGVAQVVVTQGARGARLWDRAAAGWSEHPSPRVTPVDTTGAGDTFAGYLAAGLDAGLNWPASMTRALAAAALSVTRPGAAESIPTASEVDAFL